jgi:mRNA deadenylase 3'-5' endonuclease subunit Ccr4
MRKQEEVKQMFDESPWFGPPLFHRKMRKVHPQGFENYEKGSIFKIMSYNITADRVLQITASHLSPDDPCHNPIYRMTRVLSEIENSCPDILCLQEVSTKTAYPFLKEELDNLGYQLVEFKETQGTEGQPKTSTYGLLTAFRKDKFEIIEK